ncbi:MAG: fused MFS/spermidine synthase [Oscillospiraceae bacterium]|nr:fused MFS/spermidine synthase [Oscillospiraceae bacterium]
MGDKLIKNKYFLYATEFFAGMSVMAVELGASRLTAPYFSSSQIVWTVIIGVIMIAMAVGNLWGGNMADKSKSPDRLYGRVILAAIWIALIPFVGRWLIAGITVLLALFITKNFLVWAALVACLVIFAFPCVLLGTVTPSLTKFTVDNLDDTGKTVGRLNALNTIGSIIGTFVPTFITIPAVGTAATFLIFAGVLAALGILYFASARKRVVKGIVAVVLIAGLCFALPTYSFAFWDEEVTVEDESIYHYLQVKDSDTQTILSTNVLFGVQSIRIKDRELTGMYYDYALAAPVMAGMTGGDNDSRSVMILGMGSGTYATYVDKYFPGAAIRGAEIDEKIVDIASDYFDLPDRVEVAVADGRAYLTATEERFDVIMVDAYQDITIPFQLSSVEFFSAVKEHLKPGGVMVVNLNMTSAQEGSINNYLCDTMASVFAHTYTVNVSGNTNTEVFCTDSGELPSTFAAARGRLENPDYAAMMERVEQGLTEYWGGGHILTDDKAPVELLGMRVLDELIGDELAYYKELFRNGEFTFDF